MLTPRRSMEKTLKVSGKKKRKMNSLTLDGRRPGTVVKNSQLPEYFSWTHRAQLHTFFCNFNLTI